jgi:hypothetical protein
MDVTENTVLRRKCEKLWQYMDIQNRWENTNYQNSLLSGQVTEDRKLELHSRKPGSSIE